MADTELPRIDHDRSVVRVHCPNPKRGRPTAAESTCFLEDANDAPNATRPATIESIHERSWWKFVPVSLVVGLMVLVGVAGCRRSPEAADLLAQANETNIQRLANLYVAFQSRNDWRGPTDEADFKAFLKGWNPTKLANIGVDPNAIEDLFISTRDGMPFKIRYGIPGHIMGSDAAVIFESTGVDGKRMVGLLNMTTQEVDPAEYERLWSAKPASTNQR